MKTVIGVFVLVACLQLEADGAVFRGHSKGCKMSDVPEDIRYSCHEYHCANDEYTILTCGIYIVDCARGQAVPGKTDLSKPYPDCCPQPFCVE